MCNSDSYLVLVVLISIILVVLMIYTSIVGFLYFFMLEKIKPSWLAIGLTFVSIPFILVGAMKFINDWVTPILYVVRDYLIS